MPAMPLFISVSEAASLPNCCFIDVRSRVVHGWDALGAYSRGHIAGAQFLAFDRVFAREPVFELGRHPWPDRRTIVFSYTPLPMLLFTDIEQCIPNFCN